MHMTGNKGYRGLVLAGGIALASLACPFEAAAQQVIKLGWGTADSAVDPYAITAHAFAEELEQIAPGAFDIRFFPSIQLGDETQMLQSLQLGTQDMGVFTSTYVGNIEPAFKLNDLPFLYASSAQAHAVLDGPVGDLLAEKLEARNLALLGFAEAGFRQVLNNKRPVYVPSDLSGIRLRVQPSDLFLDSFRALDANPVPMSWSDVFTAVQQGTIDGLEIPLPVIYANKFPEITKYLSLTNHTYNVLTLLISDQTMKRLDETQREAIREAGRRATQRQREVVALQREDILGKIRETGMEVNEVEDINDFREKVLPVYEAYRDLIGTDILDAALEQVQR